MDEKLVAEIKQDRNARMFLMEIRVITVELTISAGHWERECSEVLVGTCNETLRRIASGSKKTLMGLSRENRRKKK
jgi:hypothetical protein